MKRAKVSAQSDSDWIASTLLNDEASSDDELYAHFRDSGPMSEDEAAFYVDQRTAALRDGLNFDLQPYKR